MQSNTATIIRYYKLVDSADYEPMFDMFSEDIIYERGGHPAIDGMADFRGFYLNERKIASGRHMVESVVENGDWVAARGVFTGELRSGEPVTTRWADFHHFRGERICRRYTYFADQAV